MLYHSMPGLMAFPRLVAQAPVVMPKGELNAPPSNSVSDPDALDAAAREIIRRISAAKNPI
jgi:hypothetical protein